MSVGGGRDGRRRVEGTRRARDNGEEEKGGCEVVKRGGSVG